MQGNLINFFAGRNNANPGDEEQNRGLSPNGPPLQNGREGSDPLTGGRGMVDRACFTMRLNIKKSYF